MSKASQWTIEQVAAFGHQVTGVSVSEDDRIFVNFPRWTEDTAVSVAWGKMTRTARSRGSASTACPTTS